MSAASRLEAKEHGDMSYIQTTDQFGSTDIQELSFDEVEMVDGAAVNWYGVAKFAGRAVSVGGRLGVYGLAGAAVATVAYIAVDALVD